VCMASEISIKSFELAQRAIADLKIAIFQTLASGSEDGMKNVEIGKALGLYSGLKDESQQGYITRTVLALLEADGAVKQDSNTKRWLLAHKF